MNESKATRYQRLRRRARTASTVSAGLMLGVIALTPIGSLIDRAARAAAAGLSGPAETAVALGVFVLLVVLLWDLASLPAVLYLTLGVDKRYGQTAVTVEDVLGAQAHATAIALPGVFAAGAIVLVCMRAFGPWWWLGAGFVLAVGLVGALHAAPAVLVALAEIRPVGRDGLVERLAVLAERAKVPVAGIGTWSADSTHAAAIVTGVGARRRVLLSSNLVRQWTDDEIAVVVAHELAHHVYGDLWWTLALDVLVMWSALFMAQLVVRWPASIAAGELSVLPLVALVAVTVWTAATPVRHAQSRRQERRADLFALAMTGAAEPFGMAIKRLGAQHLAEEHPSALTRWLYHRHPSVAERLALADAYRRLRPGA